MPHIIKRCQQDNNYSDEDMVILEKELKRYLVLAMLNKENGLGLGMYSKMLIIFGILLFYLQKPMQIFARNIVIISSIILQKLIHPLTRKKRKKYVKIFKLLSKAMKKYSEKKFMLFGYLICVNMMKMITEYTY